jgi:hypothetical protein
MGTTQNVLILWKFVRRHVVNRSASHLGTD